MRRKKERENCASQQCSGFCFTSCWKQHVDLFLSFTSSFVDSTCLNMSNQLLSSAKQIQHTLRPTIHQHFPIVWVYMYIEHCLFLSVHVHLLKTTGFYTVYFVLVAGNISWNMERWILKSEQNPSCTPVSRYYSPNSSNKLYIFQPADTVKICIPPTLFRSVVTLHLITNIVVGVAYTYTNKYLFFSILYNTPET